MCFLRIAGDLFGCVLIRHVEIAGAFPALEGAGELNVVFGYAQDVLDRDFSRFGWAPVSRGRSRAAEVRRRSAR